MLNFLFTILRESLLSFYLLSWESAVQQLQNCLDFSFDSFAGILAAAVFFYYLLYFERSFFSALNFCMHVSALTLKFFLSLWRLYLFFICLLLYLRVTVVFYYVLFKIHTHSISFVILRCRRGSNIRKAAGDNNKNNKKKVEINKK